MRRKLFYALLGAEIVLCLLFSVLKTGAADVFTATVTFPFEQIGLALRWLSLSGTAGNAAAVCVYIIICLVPVPVFFLLGKRRVSADYFLLFMSGLLFFVMYYMINPRLFHAELPQAGKMILGGTFYSVFAGYLILRFLQRVQQSGGARTEKSLRLLLQLLIVLFVFMALEHCLDAIPAELQALREKNTAADGRRFLTSIFLVLKAAINALPYALDALVAFSALRLLDEMASDRYSDEAINAAERLSALCIHSVAATLLVSMAFNLLQMLFASQLLDISTTVYVPLFSVAFVLAVLLVVRNIRENQRLKRDNDLFI